MTIDDIKLWGGLSGIALLLGSPIIIPKVKGILVKIKGLIPGIKTKNSLDAYTDHELTTYLISKCSECKDEEGVMLLSAYGKHLYDHMLKESKNELN